MLQTTEYMPPLSGKYKFQEGELACMRRKASVSGWSKRSKHSLALPLFSPSTF